METELDVRKKDDLISAMNKADIIVNKKYFSNLADYNIVPFADKTTLGDLNKTARFYKVEQFVFDKTENTRDKLVSVFLSVAVVGASVFILIDSNGSKIEYYLGARTSEKNLAEAHEILYKSLCANFPGITFKNYSGNADSDGHAAYRLAKPQVEQLAKQVFETNNANIGQPRSITNVTGIAGLRNKQETPEQKFVQGIEKVIEAMRGERYSLLLIADPISDTVIQTMRRGYENLYSALKPFETTDLTYGENENESVTETLSQGITDTINQSISNTITKTEGKNCSTANVESDTKGGMIKR